MGQTTSKPDFNAVIQYYAARQHGVVARRQLLAAGIPGTSIDRRLGRQLFKVFPGSYAVGRRQITQDGLWSAAVLAAGHGAVLGYRAAGAAWGIVDARPIAEVVRRGRKRSCRSQADLGAGPGPILLIVRSSRYLPDGALSSVRGIPVLTVERTLLDLASVLTPSGLQRAFIEADRLGLLNDARLLYWAGKGRGRPGADAFRRLVTNRLPGIDRTKSLLEGLFLPLCRDHDIPFPEINVPVGDHKVDCLWREQRLIVELDSRTFHRGDELRERDMEQTNRYLVEGWTVLRFSWRMVIRRADLVAAQVKNRLEATGSEVARRT